MTTIICRWIAVVFVLWSSSVVAAELRAGAATSNITPEIGAKLIGNFLPVVSTHIHDELLARCLVLDDGTTRLALVVCDSLGMHRAVSDAARERIEQRLTIPASNVLICATHTHSAPSALGEDRYQQQPKLDDYQRFVVSRIVDGVARAANNLSPAEIAYGSVEAPEHVFNRRWYLRPGTMPPNPFGGVDQVKMNPGHSPNLVEPAGPTDPTITFFAVREVSGAVIALFSTYSLHYVGGEAAGNVTSDYFGMFCRRLETKLAAASPGRAPGSPPPVCMMANGTSGDVNNIDFLHPRGPKKPYEQMEAVAHDVADKVFTALAECKYQATAQLGARYAELEVAARKPNNEQLAWAKRTLEKDRPTGVDLPYIYAERVTNLAAYPDTVQLPLQALRIGELSLGSMPCEVFCEIGLEFKSRNRAPRSALISIAHGYFGYLPTPRHHDLGGYETWLGTNWLEREASEKMLKQVITLTEELHASP
jgi:hypothetical protein